MYYEFYCVWRKESYVALPVLCIVKVMFSCQGQHPFWGSKLVLKNDWVCNVCGCVHLRFSANTKTGPIKLKLTLVSFEEKKSKVIFKNKNINYRIVLVFHHQQLSTGDWQLPNLHKYFSIKPWKSIERLTLKVVFKFIYYQFWILPSLNC